MSLLASLQACSGLPISHADGSTTYVIVGIGSVTVPTPKGPPEVAVVRARALGLAYRSEPTSKLTLGYTSELVTLVSTDSPGIFVETDGDGATTVTRPQ